ncbi:DsbA family protein [Deinococcus altitudinis]|uniref:DsbA family protein n=1 Tax=Deinococcus altitudinis TaxID=468914 RepID=UPI003891876E
MTRLNAKSSNRTILMVGTLVAVILIALVVFAVRPGGSANTKSFDLSGQPLLGQESAKVTLVVFEDFKCPNCKNFEDNTMPTVQSKYIDTGKVKLYKINFPFIGPDSTTAAEAAECVYAQKQSAGYNQFATLLFRAQGDEKTQWATKAKMEDLGTYVDGLDAAKFKTCVESESTKAQVDADTAQATKSGVTGTPSVFVNGVLSPDYSAGTVGAAIDKALQ